MVATSQLAKIVGYGGCIVAFTGYYLQHSYRNKLRETAIYKETIQSMRSNQKVVTHLGEPIREGRISIGEYGEHMRWLTVRVHGSKTAGKVRCNFLPNVEGVKPSEVFRIEMEFDDRKGLSYVLKENNVNDDTNSSVVHDLQDQDSETTM